MSKYLDNKLFAMCYNFICEKYGTRELSTEQINECNNLAKSYLLKAGEFIKENEKALNVDLINKKVFDNTLYRVAIELLIEDIQANRV